MASPFLAVPKVRLVRWYPRLGWLDGAGFLEKESWLDGHRLNRTVPLEGRARMDINNQWLGYQYQWSNQLHLHSETFTKALHGEVWDRDIEYSHEAGVYGTEALPSMGHALLWASLSLGQSLGVSLITNSSESDAFQDLVTCSSQLLNLRWGRGNSWCHRCSTRNAGSYCLQQSSFEEWEGHSCGAKSLPCGSTLTQDV